MVTLGPKGDLRPLSVDLLAGEVLYRLFSNTSGRLANEFNPGKGKQTRFAFFGDPLVPVLYAAGGEESAVAETLLHDVPISGGALRPDDYLDKVMGRLTVQRRLRLVSFMGMGTGLRALGVDAADLTMTESDRYAETVEWSAAAHEAGFDGIVWMSRQCNTERAYMFFGDRVAASDVEIDTGFARAFALPDDVDWLTRMCLPLRVAIRR